MNPVPRRAATSDFGRRLKASLALADRTVASLAASIPPEYRLSVSTIDRLVGGHRPPHDWEIPLFAAELDVPEWFLRDGFNGRPAAAPADLVRKDLRELKDELARRDERLEQTLSQLRDQFARRAT
jgi:hypothetical protein